MPEIILAAHGGITTYYKQDIDRGWLHNGIDQGHNNGTAYDLQILAPAAGVVTATGRQGTYGNRLVIRHDDGWRSLLAHHDEQFVTVGQRVTRGQHIATMGNSGTVYVHSHQELWSAAGVMQDPLAHLGTASTAASENSPVIITAPPTPEEEDDMKPVILTNSKGIGIIINWAEGTWRGLYGSETAAHKANGYKVTQAASDADYEAIKTQLRPWKR